MFGNTLSVTTPGTYTVWASAGQLSLSQTLAIVVNTVAPGAGISATNNILSCANQSLIIQGSSPSQNVNYLWQVPASTIINTNSSYTALVNYSIAPSNTFVGSYSLTVTNTINLCKSSTTYSVYQNIFKPTPSITVKGNTFITCYNPTATIINTSSTTIPNNGFFSNNKAVKIIGWATGGPGIGILPEFYPDSGTISGPGMAYVSVKDLNNGCTNTIVVTIQGNMTYPHVDLPESLIALCQGEVVDLNAAVTNTVKGVKYQWNDANGSLILGATTPSLKVNAPGNYYFLATDSVSGCKRYAMITVGCVGLKETLINPSAPILIYPNPVKDVLNIGMDNSGAEIKNISINNVLGKTVYYSDNFQSEISTNHLQTGLYFVKAETIIGQKYCGKFVKE